MTFQGTIYPQFSKYIDPEVRACKLVNGNVETSEVDRPDFYSVYATTSENTETVLADFDTAEQAHYFCALLYSYQTKQKVRQD